MEGIVGNLRSIAEKEGVTIDDESLHVIAMKADGAMRDALTIFDQTVAFCGKEVRYEEVIKNLNVLDYEYSFALTDAFLAGDYKTAFLKFDEILSKGFNALHFVSALSSHFRDLLVSRTSGLEALLDLPDSLKKRYREQAGRCPLPFIYEAMNITVQCESSYRASINPRFLIELTLMRLSTLASRLAGQPVLGGMPVQDRPTAPAPQPQSTGKTPETAPAPQPAESVPAASRQRKARTARASSSLSLHSIMDEMPQAEAGKPVAETAGQRHVSNEDILSKWPELAAMYASKPRLSNTLSASSVSISEEDGTRWLTFKVLNEAQKNWIETKLLHELEGRFKQLTGAFDIRLRVDIEPEEERPQVNYMPSEKLNDLMSRNDEVRNLVSDFGLDLK